MTAEEGDRHSKAGEDPEIARTPEEIAAAEARNALRQFDRLRELVKEATSSDASETQRAFRLRPSTLMELNRLAIEDLHPRAGAYRTVSIEIGGAKHQPPPHEEVPALVDDLCEYINSHGDHPAIHLAAYVMWRLNWIHPFYDGNGRTTRAISYLVLCARLGYEIPGTITIPEIIARDKRPYYNALEEADSALENGAENVRAMEGLLESALAQQLASVISDAQRGEGRLSDQPRGIRATDEVPPSKPAPERDSLWKRQPRWRKVVAGLLAAALSLATAGWQLLINWDNEQVKNVKEWLLSGGEVADEPNATETDAEQPGEANRRR